MGLCDTIYFQERTCNEAEFQCNASHCIPGGWRCDGENDCLDWSDEQNCDSVDSPCLDGNFRCELSLKCIANDHRCDGSHDCGEGDYSDEHNCGERQPNLLIYFLLVLSADSLYKQFGSRFKLFDTLVVFLKFFFKKKF